MKTLRIYNYEILNFDSDPMVFSPIGFTKITEPKMAKALQHLAETQSTLLPQDELEQILLSENLNPASGIDFLRSISIIGEHAEPPYFENAIIYTDWDISNELKSYLKRKSHDKTQIRKLPLSKTPKAKTPTLFILAYLKLCPDLLRKTYTAILDSNPDCGISVGFISGKYFHLTEVYIPSIGNPCAFCTLDRIAHYEQLRPSHHHWYKIWAFCRSKKIALPKTAIDELQNALILGTVTSFSNKLIHPQKSKLTQDQTLLSRTLNLENGTFTEDNSIHWPLCQCLGLKP
ncbi:McbB family protein [Pseudomonas guariconensis]|uniref:McbB family protein n=1 Tax=Pseudomonas TaxID=286 RepID=UPI002096AD40|nr:MULTISPECIES: McbB family protein [Pseudomonas]MCO7516908.1 McbB family protein [Pseudomonas putida]MCO7607351.1 McbB family protein [Pseudomonas guariconensis]